MVLFGEEERLVRERERGRKKILIAKHRGDREREYYSLLAHMVES